VVYYHYNPSYYADLVTGLGFKPVMNYMSFEVPFASNSVQDALTGISKRIVEKNGVTFEKWRERKLDIRKEEMFSIYNEAWANNFGFVPFSREELYKIIDDMQLVMDKDLFVFAYVHGQLAGFFGAVPNIFESIAVDRNRHGFEMLRAIKLLVSKSKIKGVRSGYLGVKKAYRKMGLEAPMILETTLMSIKKGYEYSDMGWILENNAVMLKTIERVGAKLSKRYTLYEKMIAESQLIPVPEQEGTRRSRSVSPSAGSNPSEVA
jgi:hypothetical protein